jgi:secretion/DNA translocation related TadE-like protein
VSRRVQLVVRRSWTDTGSGTVLVLALAAVLALVGTLLAGVAAVAVARHRAASAADLAALAAADRALAGRVPACAAARRAAAAVAAGLLSCRLDRDVADVVVVLRPPGPLGGLGQATSRARAGPAADTAARPAG